MQEKVCKVCKKRKVEYVRMQEKICKKRYIRRMREAPCFQFFVDRKDIATSTALF